MTVSTASPTLMKTTLDTVYVNHGTYQPINTTMATGKEISVPSGTEPALLAVPPVKMDTSQNNARTVFQMLTSMSMVSAHVTQTGLASIVESTSESVTHDVMDALLQAMVLVTTVLTMPAIMAASVNVLLTSPDQTAHSIKQIVTTNVTDVMTRPTQTITLIPTTTVSTV